MEKRRLAFWCGAVALSAAACLALGAVYLAGIRYADLPIPSVFFRIPIVRHFVVVAKWGPLAEFIKARADEQSKDAFATVWDTDNPVLLSRTLYRAVEMFGEQKYMYKPGLRKMSVWASQGHFSIGLETVDTPELRAALKRLAPAHLATAAYDRQGFRQVDAGVTGACAATAMFLGDSFTDGMWVDNRETFVSQYARIASQAAGRRLCAVNTGVNGYGSLEEAYVLEHYFEPAGRPPLVLLMHFPNDVDNDYRSVLDGGMPDLAIKWERSLAYVRRMAAFSRAQGATFVVVAIPSLEQLARPETRRHYQAVLAAFCEGEHVFFVDPLDRLRALSAQDLYFGWDPHLTPRGHRALADALYAETRVLLYGLLTRS